MTSELSNKIANMCFICACCVVSIHAGQFTPSPVGSVVWWFRVIFAQCFARVAVPWFFFVSGWLLARHMNSSGWYLIEVKKRIKSLILPMLFWCGIWVLILRVHLCVLAIHYRGLDLFHIIIQLFRPVGFCVHCFALW